MVFIIYILIRRSRLDEIAYKSYMAAKFLPHHLELPEKFTLPHLDDRIKLGALMERIKAQTMIEIGVQNGGFAEAVLDKWPSFKHYFGVDPYVQQTNYNEDANVPNFLQNVTYNYARRLLADKFGADRITLIRDYSLNAVDTFIGKRIDFIYLDGRHDYCSVSLTST